MEVRKVEIDMHQGYANSPTFVVYVDKIPNDLIYFQHKNLYWGTKEGFVRFFSHNPENERGYGGASFTLRVRNSAGDVTEKTIKGPWSSRAGVMNKYFAQCVDITYIDDEGYHYSGAILLNTLEKFVKTRKVELNGDIKYEPEFN